MGAFTSHEAAELECINHFVNGARDVALNRVVIDRELPRLEDFGRGDVGQHVNGDVFHHHVGHREQVNAHVVKGGPDSA